MAEYSNDYGSGSTSWYGRIPPSLLAALIFAIPFMIVDFFNYYSAGTALALALPIQFVLYVGVGALAGKFTASRGSNNFIKNGAIAGISLWLISTVVNTIIALIVGAASLGSTLLLGLPYLCLCAPFGLIGSLLVGGLGGVIYGWLHGRSSDSGDNSSYQ